MLTITSFTIYGCRESQYKDNSVYILYYIASGKSLHRHLHICQSRNIHLQVALTQGIAELKKKKLIFDLNPNI